MLPSKDYRLYSDMADEAYHKIRFFTWFMYKLGAFSREDLATLDNNTHNLMVDVTGYIQSRYLPTISSRIASSYTTATLERVKWFCCKMA